MDMSEDEYIDNIKQILENGEPPAQRVTNKMLWFAIRENNRLMRMIRDEARAGHVDHEERMRSLEAHVDPEHEHRIRALEDKDIKERAYVTAALFFWGIAVTFLNWLVF